MDPDFFEMHHQKALANLNCRLDELVHAQKNSETRIFRALAVMCAAEELLGSGKLTDFERVNLRSRLEAAGAIVPGLYVPNFLNSKDFQNLDAIQTNGAGNAEEVPLTRTKTAIPVCAPAECVFVLQSLLSREAADAILGDLNEELAILVKDGCSRAEAKAWLYRQVLISVWPAICWRGRHLTEKFLKAVGVLQAIDWIFGKL